MPTSWSSSFKHKMRLTKMFDRFKRKVSVVEITDPSLEDFLSQRNAAQATDDDDASSHLSMCSTCHEKMQAQEEVAPETLTTEPVSPTTPRSTKDNQSQVSLIIMPRISAANWCGTHSRAYERRISEDTVMASPSALVKAFRDCIPEHPALIDLPPPFNRHSDPTYKEGPAKRAEIVRQASQNALERKCSDLDGEAEKLAARLEESEKELERTREQLEKAIEELAAREEAASFHVRRYNTITLQVQGLQSELAKSRAREEASKKKISTLQRCRRHRHCTLRSQLADLTQQLETTTTQLQNLTTSTRFENDLFASEAQSLRTTITKLQNQNYDLQEHILDLESQRSSEEDIAATQLAEREVFVVHERLRECERELKQRRTSLEVVRQNNADLAAEMKCLKLRLRDGESGVRYTV